MWIIFLSSRHYCVNIELLFWIKKQVCLNPQFWQFFVLKVNPLVGKCILFLSFNPIVPINKTFVLKFQIEINWKVYHYAEKHFKENLKRVNEWFFFTLSEHFISMLSCTRQYHLDTW